MPTKTRERVLSDDEIRQVLTDQSEVGRILQLCLYTGSRPGEAQNIKREDITDYWWECQQNKGGKVSGRRSYLTCAARSIVGKGKGWAFSVRGQPTVAQYCRRRGYGFRPHDIRRTVATRLAELGYSDEQIHRFLGHSVDKLTRTYNLYRYDKELQEMAEAWGAEVQRILCKA